MKPMIRVSSVRSILLTLVTVFTAQPLAVAQCPTMTSSNVFIAFQGAASGCTQNSGTCIAGETIALTVTGFAYDFNCAVHAYSWNFGGYTKNITHSFSTTAAVSVAISNGTQTFVAFTTVPIASSPTCPVMTANNIFLSFIGSTSGCSQQSGTCMPGETVTLTLSAFGYDFGCANHTFIWSFGASGRTVTHVFSSTTNVSVTINNGSQSFTATTTIPVGNPPAPPPTSCNANQIQISPAWILPAANVGRTYTQILTATGGSPPYSFSVNDGVLPTGLVLTGNTILGTPVAEGVFQFSIRAADTRACSAVMPYTMTVATSSCGEMLPGINSFLKFLGSASDCTESRAPCFAAEPILFSVWAPTYDFSCLEHTFIWNFGDGQIVAGRDPIHVYLKPGTYPVMLVISNSRQLVQLSANAVVVVAKRRATRH